MHVKANLILILTSSLILRQYSIIYGEFPVMDVHSPEQRSFNMSRIRGKDTRPELAVRRWLWANGYRYRLHGKGLPGKPDIVLPMYHTVIFVHGCYWHRHGCRYTTFPVTRSSFWSSKFKDTVIRDKRNYEELHNAGWNILIIWECKIKNWDSITEDKIRHFLKCNTDNN